MALSAALGRWPDDRGMRLLEVLIHFQTSHFQPDGQFQHIGFESGELSKQALIHNMVPSVSLCAAALMLGERLSGKIRQEIDRAVRKVLATCERFFQPGPNAESCCNQEYCRLWAQLLHMSAFEHSQWHDQVARGLDYMIEHFHVAGLGDDSSSGTLRTLNDPYVIEPAEYYGLMIPPLIEGYRRYGENRYLEQARRLARHCARSSWVDDHGQRRLHRIWYKMDDRWILVREPMLIGGMGLTLASIDQLNQLSPENEWAEFLEQTDRTYAHYQSPAGFFLAASGWQMEQDIIPSTAWQSHDLYHLLLRHGAGSAGSFWEPFFLPLEGAAVVLGCNTVWIEDRTHWTLRGYETCLGACEWIGRKDQARFEIDRPNWMAGDRTVLDPLVLTDLPRFLRTDREIHHVGGRGDLLVLSAQNLPYVGPAVAMNCNV